MIILLDEEGYTLPTFRNIVEAFKRVSEDSLPGDAVFVQFSGHGGRVLDATVDSEAESYDEVIVPLDYKECGLIRDTLIFKTLLAPMRFGVTVTVMIDCCDTGMLMELPYAWSAKNDKKDVVAKVCLILHYFGSVFLSFLILFLLNFRCQRMMTLVLLDF